MAIGTLVPPPIGTASQKAPRLTAAERQAQRRDSKGWRSAPKRNRLGEPTVASEKAAARKHEVEVIRDTREKVWLRSEDRCEVCAETQQQTAERCHKATHEMHEVLKRSATRGWSAEARFNSQVALRVCRPCHDDLERHRVSLIFDSPIPGGLGADSDFAVVDRDGVLLRRVVRPSKVGL